MPGDQFVFRGNLAETSLPLTLSTIHRYRVPGVVEFARESESKRVYFVDGDVIFATSSDRGESLGEYLLRKGTITSAQYQVSCEELDRSPGMRHGAVIVQLGFLSVDDLGAAVREQVQQILWSLFNWQDGRVTFRVGRFRDDEVYQIKIPTPRAIMSGCKHITDARLVAARIGGRNTVYHRVDWPDHLSGFRLEAGEQKLLDMIDGKRTLYDLCENGPLSAGVNARVLVGFCELQIVERHDAPSGAIRIQVRSSRD